MIDEELYQQAANELNSDRRRPHIWARACALASDDQDEARFLYTNLRVEELLEERENAKKNPASAANSSSSIDADSTLALVEEDAPDANDIDEFVNELKSKSEHDDIPESFSAPSGEDNHESLDDFLSLEPTSPATEGSAVNASLSQASMLEDPDSDLMADYVAEELSLPDDTYAGDDLAEDEFAMELARFKAEEGEPSDIVADVSVDDSILEFDGTAQINPISDTVSKQSAEEDIPSDALADVTAAHPDDLTQANLDVLDAHAGELDSMLGDVHYEPQAPKPESDILWEDDELSQNQSKDSRKLPEDSVIYEDDPYTENLGQQAAELDLDSPLDLTADYSEHIAEAFDPDDDFPEPAYSHDETHVPAAVDTSRASTSTEIAAATAATAATLSENATSVPQDNHPENTVWPMDLTADGKGKQFSIYRRNNDAQAVRNGVSWTALFLTFPYLLYRHLFGTAIAYAGLWVIAIGGLIVSGLAWLDAGLAVTPLIQACTIGFGLLAFIGMIYLPFRYGNTWRSTRLENRGYELVAMTKAKNPGRAISLARQHSALNV